MEAAQNLPLTILTRMEICASRKPSCLALVLLPSSMTDRLWDLIGDILRPWQLQAILKEAFLFFQA